MADERRPPRGGQDRGPRRDNRQWQDRGPRQDRSGPQGQGQQQAGGGVVEAIVVSYRIVERSEQDGNLLVILYVSFTKGGRPLSGPATIEHLPEGVTVLTETRANLDSQGGVIFALQIPVTDPLNVPFSVRLEQPSAVCSGVIRNEQKRPVRLVVHGQMVGENFVVTGTVYDQTGDPLHGTTVLWREGAATLYTPAQTNEHGVVTVTAPMREREGAVTLFCPAIAESEQTVTIPATTPQPPAPAQTPAPAREERIPTTFRATPDREGANNVFVVDVWDQNAKSLPGAVVQLLNAARVGHEVQEEVTNEHGQARFVLTATRQMDVKFQVAGCHQHPETKVLYPPPAQPLPPLPHPRRRVHEGYWDYLGRCARAARGLPEEIRDAQFEIIVDEPVHEPAGG